MPHGFGVRVYIVLVAVCGVAAVAAPTWSRVPVPLFVFLVVMQLGEEVHAFQRGGEQGRGFVSIGRHGAADCNFAPHARQNTPGCLDFVVARHDESAIPGAPRG